MVDPIKIPGINDDKFYKQLVKNTVKAIPETTDPELLSSVLSDLNDLGDIHELFVKEEKLFDFLDEKIEKVYKTLHGLTGMSFDKQLERLSSSIETAKKNSEKKTVEKSTNVIKDSQEQKEKYSKEIKKDRVSIDKRKTKETPTQSKLAKFSKVAQTAAVTATRISISTVSRVATMSAYAGLAIAKSMVSCITTFFMIPFKAAWKVIDHILSYTGPIWDTIKKVLMTAGHVVKWVVGVGIQAIGFIWKGISTIFKGAYTAISSVAKYLIHGVEGFFSWWFKGLFSFMFSPAMLLITLPSLIFIGIGVITAINALVFSSVGVLLPVAQAVIEDLVQGFEIIGSWVWSGVKAFFSFVESEYKGSWLQSFVNKMYDDIQKSVIGLLGGHKNISSALSWLSNAEKWIEVNYDGIVKWVGTEVKKTQDFFKDFSKETLLEHYMNFLGNYKNVPGVGMAYDFLQRRFGFTKAGGISNQIENQIKLQKSKGFQESIENVILANSNMSAEALDSKINDEIIPKLQSTIFGGLDDKTIADIISKAHASVKRGVKFTAPKQIENSGDYIAVLQSQLAKINAGQLNSENAGTRDELLNDVLAGSTYISSANTSSLKYSSEDIQKQLEHLQDKMQQYAFVQTFQTSSEYHNQNLDYNVLGTSTNKQRYNLLAKEGQGILAGIDNVGIGAANFLVGNGYKNEGWTPKDSVLETDPDLSDTTQSGLAGLNTANFAFGGIVSKEMNNILPLDNLGRDYIRSKVKDIPSADIGKSNRKEDDIRNITIIEEHSSLKESYELYTMNQLSKGILGAN